MPGIIIYTSANCTTYKLCTSLYYCILNQIIIHRLMCRSTVSYCLRECSRSTGVWRSQFDWPPESCTLKPGITETPFTSLWARVMALSWTMVRGRSCSNWSMDGTMLVRYCTVIIPYLVVDLVEITDSCILSTHALPVSRLKFYNNLRIKILSSKINAFIYVHRIYGVSFHT